MSFIHHTEATENWNTHLCWSWAEHSRGQGRKGRKTEKGQFSSRRVFVPGKTKPQCGTAAGAESPYNICSDKKPEPRQEEVCLRENCLLEDRRLLHTDSVLQKYPGQGNVRASSEAKELALLSTQRYSRHSRALPGLAALPGLSWAEPGHHSIPELVTPPASQGKALGTAGGALLFLGSPGGNPHAGMNCLPSCQR